MKKKRIIGISIFSGLFLIAAATMVAANVLALKTFASVLTSYFGIEATGNENYSTNQHYPRAFETAEEASAQADALNLEIEREGAVLLKNNGVLPLKKASRVSCFSQSSYDNHFIYGSSSGSGAIAEGNVPNLYNSLRKKKIIPNKILWDFYGSHAGEYQRVTGGLASGHADNNAYPWAINEMPVSLFTSEVENSFSKFSDAAIIVVSRTGCENGDLPTDMSYWDSSNHGSLLELDSTEKEMFAYVTSRFSNTIVLLNTGNVMDLSFLDDYDIDACLWVGGVGQYGLGGVADILAGKVNPSGRLTDTYPYDLFSSPAMQNFGNYAYTQGGSETGHHYVTYAEGIYVGYKYYETRYEDAVLGRGNAGGFNYDEQVRYPFGYGLSYTSFQFSNFSASLSTDRKSIHVSTKITNTGNVSGKEVVEFYAQSPYTDYDITKQIEKSAVELVEFGKTNILEPGQSETVEADIPVESLKSYDAMGVGGYLLEGSSSYYICAAKNSHEATKSILQAKGQNVGGDSSLAAQLHLDEQTYLTDSHSGGIVENRFDDASGESFHSEIKYLSRSDWSVMNDGGIRFGDPDGVDGNGPTYRKEAPSNLKSELDLQGYAAAKAPDETFTSPEFGNIGSKTLIELKDVPASDPRWDDLLDQASFSEAMKIVTVSGYKTYEMLSVSKPYATDADGPSSWNSFIGDGISAGGYPYEVVLASTWNKQLAYQMGNNMGELSLWQKILASNNSPNLTGWYAPAINIHRTPFGGRNFEYYSEDSYLTSRIGAGVVKGARDKGTITFVKHFAMNEQETNRMTDNVVWAREQTIREIYLKPFEYCVKEGQTLAIMSAYNRVGSVWAGGNYALISGVLRQEWGFDGYVLTDYMDGDYENMDQMLAAGGDAALNVVDSNRYVNAMTKSGNQAKTYIRRAIKHILYATANSNAMNGYDRDVVVTVGKPKYHAYVMWIDVGLSAILVGFLFGAGFHLVKGLKESKTKE